MGSPVGSGTTRTSPGGSGSSLSAMCVRLAAERSVLISTSCCRPAICSAVTRLAGLVRLRMASRGQARESVDAWPVAEAMSSCSGEVASSQCSGAEKRASAGRRAMNSNPIGISRPSPVAAAICRTCR